MAEYVLRTYGLTKKYGEQCAVDHVNMSVKKGEIYGFIGLNGAGKTTLLRLVTGLAHATTGSVELFGSANDAELQAARLRIGSVIESPALYLNMTASQNLEHYRLLTGTAGKACIDENLAMVGLDSVGSKKVKNFSLGMKQRLGLAIALLANPDLILLDEPTNGLDPSGILEMRGLLKSLARDKKITLIVSSHILPELSQLATCYGIIHHGKLIRELSTEELGNECKQCLKLLVNDAKRAVTILEDKLHAVNYKVLPNNEIRLFDYIDRPSEVTAALVKDDIQVYSITTMGQDLEGFFIDLTGGAQHA